MRVTTSFVSRANTCIGSALASFVHRHLEAAEGVYSDAIPDVAAGHTLVDIVIANPTRRDLVERAARQDLVAVVGFRLTFVCTE